MNEILHLWLLFALAVIVGFMIGRLLYGIIFGNKVDGTITVDMSDDNKIIWKINYDGDPYELQERDKVTFKIEKKG